MALLVLVGLVVTPTAAPAGPPDPTRGGAHPVTRVDYDAGPAVLAVQPANGAPVLADLRGELHVPTGRGPFPVVVLLHGRHGTCTYASFEFLGHPCPRTPVTTPVDSYRGYRYLASNLASHGFLVASIDANGVNTYDSADLDAGALARAELVSRSLDLLGTWGSGRGQLGETLQGRVDLRRIGLMGHSRGGEGVTRWLRYNQTRTDGPRYPVSGVFSLAPTDFGDHLITDRTPYAVLLPRCDGDVSDLQGADVFERSQYVSEGPLHQIVVEGANHNWFNSIWTGDDSGFSRDRACDPAGTDGVRLTTEQQERVGLTWMAAFFRRYVGGERSFDGMLTGRSTTTVHCTRGQAAACHDLVELSFSPPPPRRTTLLAPDVRTATAYADDADVRVAPGRGLSVEGCDPDRSLPCPAQGSRRTPSRSKGGQLVLAWEQPSSLTVTGVRPWRAHPAGELVVRLGVNSDEDSHELGTGGLRLRVRITDAAGRTAVVRIARGPEPAPGDGVRNLLLSDVRVPLARFPQVDVRALRSVQLLLDDASGSLQLADLALHAP